MQKIIPVVFFLTCLVVSSGCVNAGASPPVNSGTPVPTTENAPVTASPAPATEPVTPVPAAERITPAAPIPDTCRAIVAAADSDRQFMDTLKKYSIASCADGLASRCDVAKATELTQILTNHSKPRSPTLLSARGSLIDAIGECIGRQTSATRTRVQESLKFYHDHMADYEDEVRPCREFLSADERQSILGVEEPTETDGGWLFAGTDGDMQKFRVENAGMYIISYRCTGQSQIFISIKDESDTLARKIESAEGQKTGKDTIRLVPGKYYLKVDTVGDWTVTVQAE